MVPPTNDGEREKMEEVIISRAYTKVIFSLPKYKQIIRWYEYTDVVGSLQFLQRVFRYDPEPLLEQIRIMKEGNSYSEYMLVDAYFVAAHCGLKNLEETLNLLTAVRMTHRNPDTRQLAKGYMAELDGYILPRIPRGLPSFEPPPEQTIRRQKTSEGVIIHIMHTIPRRYYREVTITRSKGRSQRVTVPAERFGI